MKNIIPKSLTIALFCFELTGLNAQTVTDIDGNVYNTVTIGTQTWIAENLKTTKCNDGTAIPLVTDNTAWLNLRTPGYCWYNNDQATYGNTYGALYNWYTVNTGKLCPTGWHVHTDAEWTTLTAYLGGGYIAGKLKEADTIHWQSPNTGATNETGFTALPGGFRHGGGSFYDIGLYGYWWSANEKDSIEAWSQVMHYNTSHVSHYNSAKFIGYSVRCLMGNTSMTNSIIPEEVTFYPNPATEKLYLKNNNYANTIIMIFDLQGKQVLIKQIDSNPIDISDLEKGIYVVKLVGSENVLITKFLKE